MKLRLALLLSAISLLPACAMPMGPMGPGGAAPMAATPGPTVASAGITPGEPITAENCADYRTMATQAMMMTPQIDAALRSAGC